MHDPATFVRGTNSPVLQSFRQLPANDFWNQAQAILTGFLTTDYGPEIYVPVEVAPGKPVAEDIYEFLSMKKGVSCLLLVGQYGAGKSSALTHLYYEYIEKQEDAAEPWFWIKFDANRYRAEIGGSKEQLIYELAGTVSDVVGRFLKRTSRTLDYFLQDCFHHDSAFSLQRNLNETNELTQALRNEVLETIEVRSRYLIIALRFLARHTQPNQVVMVLDNFDSHPPNIQRAAVNIAADVSAACRIKALVSVRRSTESELRFKDHDIFGLFVQTPVAPPDVTEVIRRRLQQAMSSREAQDVTLGEGVLRARVQDCPEFVDVLVKGLSSPSIQRFLNNMCNESVREALQYAMHIYSSPYIDARRIIRSIAPTASISAPFWHDTFPYYVVIKALLLRKWPIYRPDVSRIGNLFATAVPQNMLSPFLRTYMLSVLDIGQPNEMPLAQFTSILQDVLELDVNSINLELSWLTQNDWISCPDEMHVKLTQRGHFIRHVLINDIEYLTHISTDVRMYPNLCAELSIPAETLVHRLRNLLLLLRFLVEREFEILQHLSRNGLRDFLQVFSPNVITAKVLRECRRSVEAINFDTDEVRETAVGGIIEQFAKIESSRAMRGSLELIKRYHRS